MRYFASIICSREDNQRALSLKHELETFVVPLQIRRNHPGLPQRLAPICYDYSDTSMGPSLFRDRVQLLQESKYLIVICSSKTYWAEWLMREVHAFISGKRDVNVILYIIDEAFNNTFPDEWSLYTIGGVVDAYRLGESESVKRVAEIMLGLGEGSLNCENKRCSFFKQISRLIGKFSKVGSDTVNTLKSERSIPADSQRKDELPVVYTDVENNTFHKSSEGERQYDINTSTLIIRFGNLLNSDAEVIVSSDDNELSMGGGVSGAILVNGGKVILDDARKNVPAQLGDVIITTAGKLSQKYVFHCVTIDYSDGQRKTSEDKGLQEYIIRRSVDKCLRMMPLLGIESIAFPAIGAGVAHFSLEEVAISMAEIIIDFLYTTSKKYQIEIYLYDRINQKRIMDYLVFFENVAKCIDNHKRQKPSISEKEELPSVIMTEASMSKPCGKMAASSPHDEHKVFVSYSRDNVEIVRLFCEQMDELSISYWIDINGKYSGNNFKEVLVDAIDSSQVMLFLSSSESNQSPFVIKEISLAVAGNKPILPIKLDDAPYAKSIRFDLSDIDWIEYSKDKSNEAMEKFRYCLQLYLK